MHPAFIMLIVVVLLMALLTADLICYSKCTYAWEKAGYPFDKWMESTHRKVAKLPLGAIYVWMRNGERWKREAK